MDKCWPWVVVAVAGFKLMFFSANADSNELRLWERLEATIPENAEVTFGVGLFMSQYPDYPGSASSERLMLPFPYFTYYSEELEVDGSEAVGRLLTGNGWELNLNLSGSIPTRSEGNLRDGMRSLGWIGEVGPSLDFPIKTSDTIEVIVRLPVRAAIAARKLDFKYLGLRFDPQLRLTKALNENASWETTIAATYSEARYHQYMFGVKPAYATGERPEYRPGDGYSGYRVSTGVSIQATRDWWLGGFIRYQNIEHVAYSGSPLVERQAGWSFGFAVARVLYQR